jgi:hypothetical protein
MRIPLILIRMIVRRHARVDWPADARGVAVAGRLMRDTIITGIGGGLATSLCGIFIRGFGWLLNFTIFGAG